MAYIIIYIKTSSQNRHFDSQFCKTEAAVPVSAIDISRDVCMKDDKIRWTLSALANITVINQLDAAVLVQFRTRWNYLADDWKDIYYRNRTVNTSDPTRLEFYRVILALTYKL
jgi:hypothetical protein